jgi:hypothetical protein
MKGASVSMVLAFSNTGIGVLAGLAWLVLLLWLGLRCLRRGHWIMFIVGLVFPLFWVIGAVIPPTASQS